MEVLAAGSQPPQKAHTRSSGGKRYGCPRSQVLCRPTPEDEADPDRLRQTHLEQAVANQRFRPLTEFLTSIRYCTLSPS